MSVLQISTINGRFTVERHIGNSQLWMQRHPKDATTGPITVIDFGKILENIFENPNDSVLIRANHEGNIELIFIHNGRVCDFRCVSAVEVPDTINKVKSTWI